MNNREAMQEAFLEFNNKQVEILFAEDYFEAGYKAALASQAQQESQWNAIETAPKDETEIIVMYMHIDTQIVHNAFYASEENGWESSDVGWWSYDKGEVSRIHLTGWMTPTHWRPLPPAPEGGEQCK